MNPAGAVYVSTTRDCIGKRSARWPGTSVARTTSSCSRQELIGHFRNRFLNQPPEQIGGVQSK